MIPKSGNRFSDQIMRKQDTPGSPLSQAHDSEKGVPVFGKDHAPPRLTRRKRGPYVSPAPMPDAQVAELVDALVSGTSGESRGGSSPLLGTNHLIQFRFA